MYIKKSVYANLVTQQTHNMKNTVNKYMNHMIVIKTIAKDAKIPLLNNIRDNNMNKPSENTIK